MGPAPTASGRSSPCRPANASTSSKEADVPLRKRKPTSAGRRFQTVSDFSEITRDQPEKSLLAPKKRSGRRNNYGRKTARHRRGGHQQRYRTVDVKPHTGGV